MNSAKQNIKRVLALSTGAVLTASTITMMSSAANAATGDVIQVAYSGPARNNGDAGAYVVLKTKGITETEAETGANIKLIGADFVSSPNNAGQSVSIVGSPVWTADGASNEFGGADGFDEVVVRVKVTTPADGATASYGVFLDDDATAGVQATEPRAGVTTSTAGIPTNPSVAPASQTVPQGTDSGDYTATLRDGAGRLTQLTTGESFVITATGDATIKDSAGVPDSTILIADAPRGTATFKASSPTIGLQTLKVNSAGVTPAAVEATATLDVVGAAALTYADIDFVTGADSWSGFGNGGAPAAPVKVRVDQTSIQVDIKNLAQAGKVVQLTVTAPASTITFGGKASTTLTTTLNAQGLGTITITPDAGTVADGRNFTISGSGLAAKTVTFERAAPTALKPASTTYVSGFGGTVTVTATVTDQFGLPVTSGLVDAQRTGGVNADAAPQAKKPVGADGTVSFTFTDTKATALSKADDTVTLRYFQDQFAATPSLTDSTAKITYTADGQGADFTVAADSTNTAGVGYDPASVSSNPLADAVANNVGGTDEFIALTISGGTTGVPVTVSVDGGALVLNNTKGETTLKQGAASKTGALTDGFRIVGTKTGLVNVTVTSAGRTKTFAVTVKAPVGPARNIAVSGPAKANSGDLAVFTATITDAFGNPVAGYSVANVNTQVSGPGRLQDSDNVSNAAGQLKLNVRLDDDADGPVTVNVTASGAEFGAVADSTTAAPTGLNPGLTASVNTATATISDVVDLAGLQAAVDAAQAKVDAAQATLNAKTAQLNVAKVQLANKVSLLQAEKGDVAQLQKRINKLKAQIKRAKANGNWSKVRQLKRQLANAQRQIKAERRDVIAAQGDVNVAKASVDAAQVEVNNAQAALTAAQAELAEAEAELEEAQN